MTAITPTASHLTFLPEDLLLYIFSFHNEKELALIICRVNKVYKQIGDQEVLWEVLTLNRFPAFSKLSKAQGSTWKIRFRGLLAFHKPLQKPCYSPCRNYHLTAYPSPTYAYFNPERPTNFS
jgi:hypothetical protein